MLYAGTNVNLTYNNWFSNSDANVDTQAGVVSNTVELGGHPRGLTLVGTDLYVAHPSSFDPTKLQPGDKLGDKMPNISVIDTKTNTVTVETSRGQRIAAVIVGTGDVGQPLAFQGFAGRPLAANGGRIDPFAFFGR